MSTRETILAAVLQNQPELSPLPDISKFRITDENAVQKYINTFTGIGGKIFQVEDISAVKTLIAKDFDATKRIVTTLPELKDIAELYSPSADPHTFEDVELAVIRAHLAVAENGTVWLTEKEMGQRIIPYICQHLVVLVSEDSMVSTMHEAYERIGLGEYGFGGFIGGPSKTADIEQSLVMGAHGPITMTVYIMK